MIWRTYTDKMSEIMMNRNYTVHHGNISPSAMAVLTDNEAGRRPHDDDLALFRFVCEVIIAMPLICIGIIANVLAFFVLARQKCRLTTALLLQCLAVVDLLVLVCALLLRSIIVLHTYTGSLDAYVAVFPRIFVCLYPLGYFIRLVDTWLTTLLTMDRYIAVCRPLQAYRLCTARRTYRRVAFLLVVSLLFCLPRCFEYRVDGDSLKTTWLFRNGIYTLTYRIGAFSAVMYLIPMTFLVVLNTRLLCVMRRADRFRDGIRRMSNSESNITATSRSITVMVVAVVVVCVACNTTALVSHALWSLQTCFALGGQLDTPRRYIAHVSNVMITTNSAVNFFIYCMCSHSFRMKLARKPLKAFNQSSDPPAANHFT